MGSAENVQWESGTGECWMNRRGKWRGRRGSSGRTAKQCTDLLLLFYLFLDAKCKMPRTSTSENLLATGT